MQALKHEYFTSGTAKYKDIEMSMTKKVKETVLPVSKLNNMPARLAMSVKPGPVRNVEGPSLRMLSFSGVRDSPVFNTR